MTPASTKRLAVIDIGTNSTRLLVARLHANGSYTVLAQHRDVTRLGEGVMHHGEHLKPAAIHRTVTVCRTYAGIAQSMNAGMIIAVATAAVRDTAKESRAALSKAIRAAIGIRLRILSERDEARLIYLGVSRELRLGTRKALFLEIGGGSTELIVGHRDKAESVRVVPIGAVRMSARFMKKAGTGPVTDTLYGQMRQHALHVLNTALTHLKRTPFDIAIGSSGTVLNMAHIVARAAGHPETDRVKRLTYASLQAATRHLCRLTLDQRQTVPGIHKDRADIIIGGAVILETIMEQLQIRELRLSFKSLRDGLIIDHTHKR